MDMAELTYVTVRLLTPMRNTTLAPSVTTVAEILSRKGTRYTIYHVVMFRNIIMKQVNSLFGFHLTIKHYIVTIESSENNSVLFEMFLKPH